MARDRETTEPREYPARPIPGVGAVVLREQDGRSEVLLVRRARAPLVGAWSLPGGAIELGETAAEACVREVREETGLEVAVVAPIETFDIILRDADGAVQYHYLIVDMLCEVMGGEVRAGEDASEAVWASTEGVLERGEFALTERACTVIRRAMQRSVGLG
jgi:ADP-ribose pyrophosphatase YjhB (NUDIX family)